MFAIIGLTTLCLLLLAGDAVRAVEQPVRGWPKLIPDKLVREPAKVLNENSASKPARKRSVSIVRAPPANRQMTAEGAIKCGMQYADIDKDGRLSLREVEVIRDLALGPFRATGVWLASKVPLLKNMVSVKQIFHDCDAPPRDGFITYEDFTHMRATCLNTPGKVSDAYEWVCDKGDAGVFQHAKL